MKTASSRATSSLIRQLTMFSLIGFAYFLVTVVALHILRPDYNPISRTVSEYARGTYGPLMTTSFIALGLASAILVLALARGVSAAGRSRVGLVLITVWSLSIFVLSIFPTDRYGIPVSTSGWIHSFTALIALISLLFAALFCSLRFRHDEQWKTFAQSSLFLTVLLFVTLMVFLGSPAAFKGITERLLLLVAIVWLMWLAIKLRSLHLSTVVRLPSSLVSQ